MKQAHQHSFLHCCSLTDRSINVLTSQQLKGGRKHTRLRLHLSKLQFGRLSGVGVRTEQRGELDRWLLPSNEEESFTHSKVAEKHRYRASIMGKTLYHWEIDQYFIATLNLKGETPLH